MRQNEVAGAPENNETLVAYRRRSQQILRVVFALFRDPAAAEVAVHALVEANATSLWNMDEEELSDGVKHLAGAPLRVAG